MFHELSQQIPDCLQKSNAFWSKLMCMRMSHTPELAIQVAKVKKNDRTCSDKPQRIRVNIVDESLRNTCFITQQPNDIDPIQSYLMKPTIFVDSNQIENHHVCWQNLISALNPGQS